MARCCTICAVVILIVHAPLMLLRRLVSRDTAAGDRRDGRGGQNLMFATGGGISDPDEARPCSHPLFRPRPHCDVSLPRDERVGFLLGRLSADEKISLLGHNSPEVRTRDVYLPEYRWWNEALHGLAWTVTDIPPYRWRNVTVFPQVTGLASSYNRTLWNEVGAAIGAEAADRHSRGADGTIRAGLTYFTPNVNIFRDPRWGRGQETPGEDPYLTSHYAAVLVMALQYGKDFVRDLETSRDRGGGPGGAGFRPRIAATCKHLAAYSLETDRFNFSADGIDGTDWEGTYLPAMSDVGVGQLHCGMILESLHAERFLLEHYNASGGGGGGQDRGALGVMCSYNAIDGVPACADPALLKGMLRREWNFTGLVVADCWAVDNIHSNHRFVSSYEEAVGLALRSGVDLDCGNTFQDFGRLAYDESLLDEDDIDEALSRLFGVLMDLGYFDETDEPLRPSSKSSVYEMEHDQLALEAALQSIVLLKNGINEDEPGPLPLSLTKHKEIALFGPLADNQTVLLGNYHGLPSNIVTPLMGLAKTGVEVAFRQRTSVCDFHGESATILVVGLDQSLEAEDQDRTTLLLPVEQRDMIKAISSCSKVRNLPVVLVVVSGGMVDLSRYKVSSDIDAIIHMSYPGQNGGSALAQVLYGAYNPSGRLVGTMYPESYLNEVSLHDMRMRSDGNFPGRTHRYRGDVIYPFGYGLSYTSFCYAMEYLGGTVKVIVSNSGSMDGSVAVLLFHSAPQAGNEQEPFRSLIGFEKMYVSVGDSRLVSFDVSKRMNPGEAGSHTFRIENESIEVEV